MPQGQNFKGKKPANSGMKRGQKTKPVLLREEAERTAKERYIEYFSKMLPRVKLAQLSLALGAVKLYAKVPFSDGNGGQKTRLELVEDEQLIIDILSNEKLMKDKDYFIVQNVAPNHNSQAYILDQIIGKANSTIVTEEDGKKKPINVIMIGEDDN